MRQLRIITACLALIAAVGFAPGAKAEARFESAIQYALEKLVSGIHTESLFGGTEVAVTPIRTWKSVSGHYCREYDITVTQNGSAAESDRQTRCRDEGYWKLVPKN